MAEIILGGRNIKLCARKDLREISLGEWDGRAVDEIATTFPKEFQERGEHIEGYRVPGGESFADCQVRGWAALEQIVQSSSGNVLIVGHAGINRMLLCHILGTPISNLFRIGQDYGCLNILQFEGSECCLRLLNLTPEAAAMRADFLSAVAFNGGRNR
jgi:probable phosphoglycerate mutase